MPNETMTGNEIARAEKGLTDLSAMGCKTGKFSKKVARKLIWAQGIMKEIGVGIKCLQEGHAKVNAEGEKVKPRRKNEETGEWEDAVGFLFEDPELYTKEEKALLEETVNLSGDRFTDDEFKTGLKAYPPDPSVYVAIGALFNWEDEEEEVVADRARGVPVVEEEEESEDIDQS